MGEEASCFVSGRGLPRSLAQSMGVGLWDSGQYEDCPEDVFADRHGPTGQNMNGHISVPLWSPRGVLVGVEWRRWDGEKEVTKYFLSNSKWEPAFLGMTPRSLSLISQGSDIWLVEGLFDLSLAHVVEGVVLACGGAKMTRNQAEFLKRFVRSTAMVHVCFDMDETGRNMAEGFFHPETGKKVWGVSERLTFSGVRNRIVYYKGKDPGEIWEEGGRSLLRDRIKL